MKTTAAPPARKVLFLGHDATRTGAPALLLQFLHWLKTNADVAPELLLKAGGVLAPEFQASVPTHYYRDLAPIWSRPLPPRIWRKLKLETASQPRLNRWFPAETYPLVYANTIACLELARELCRSSRRCILHVHELEYSVRWFKMEAALRESSAFVSRYIVDSEAVRKYLVNKLGLPAERMVVVHCFPIAQMGATDVMAASRRAVRAAAGITDAEFVVGMCGTPDWRKGFDLFIQLAVQLNRQRAGAFRLIWVGGDPQDIQLRHELAAAGLAGVVHIEPPCPDPQKFFAACDAFALTSREDPFPVAMLEAALAGLPLLAFQGAGGAGELIETDAGVLVPYLDVQRLTEEVIHLADDRPRAKKLGECAQAKVAARYTLNGQSAKLLAVLQSLCRP